MRTEPAILRQTIRQPNYLLKWRIDIYTSRSFKQPWKHARSIAQNESFDTSWGYLRCIEIRRWYKRLVWRGQIKVELEIYLVSIGFNLHKFYTKQIRLQKAAWGFNITLFGVRGSMPFFKQSPCFFTKIERSCEEWSLKLHFFTAPNIKKGYMYFKTVIIYSFFI